MKLFEIWTNNNGKNMFVAERDKIGFKCRHLSSDTMTRAKKEKRGWKLKDDKYAILAADLLADSRNALTTKKVAVGLRCFDAVREKYKAYGRIRFRSQGQWRTGDFGVELRLKNGQMIDMTFDRPTTLDVMNTSLT